MPVWTNWPAPSRTPSASSRTWSERPGKTGSLSAKTKELIAFGIAINVQCDGCIANHARAVLDAGASREEVSEMIGVAMLMGDGPSSVYGVEAMQAYDEFSNAKTT